LVEAGKLKIGDRGVKPKTLEEKLADRGSCNLNITGWDTVGFWEFE
jgi:hypothetical protein